MASKNVLPLDLQAPSKALQPRKRAGAKIQRAQRQQAVRVNAAAPALLSMMTEQCRTATGFSTFYRGAPSAFADLGFPDHVLACDKRPVPFRLEPGDRASTVDQEVDAVFSACDDGLELEIRWSYSGPLGCGHPAIQEIARMAYASFLHWTINITSRVVPTDNLATHPSTAKTYALGSERTFEYSRDFHNRLLGMANEIFRMVGRGEIIETTDRDAKLAADAVIARAKAA